MYWSHLFTGTVVSVSSGAYATISGLDIRNSYLGFNIISALGAVINNCTITVASNAGIYSDNTPLVVRSVVITEAGMSGVYVSNNVRAEIYDTSILRCSGYHGGGIYVKGVAVKPLVLGMCLVRSWFWLYYGLENVELRDNLATQSGGGLYLKYVSATITNSLFDNNVGGVAGSLYVDQSVSLVMINCTMSRGNYTGTASDAVAGGLTAVSASNITLIDTTFRDIDRVVIKEQSSILTVIRCRFINNTALTQDSAAVMTLYGGTTNIIDSLFTGNRAFLYAAINGLGLSLTITGSNFTDNSCEASAIVCSMCSTLNMTDVIMQGNHASNYLLNAANTPAYIYSSTFRDNSGTISMLATVTGPNRVISGCSFINNSNSLYLQANVTISDCLFQDNSLSSEAAIYSGDSHMSVVRSVFRNNNIGIKCNKGSTICNLTVDYCVFTSSLMKIGGLGYALHFEAGTGIVRNSVFESY